MRTVTRNLFIAAVILALLPVAGVQGAKFGTHFFYWYDCPNTDCDMSKTPYDPPGTSSKYNGTYYTSLSTDWYEWQLADLETAGIDYIFPVSWGERYHPNHFKQSVLSRLKDAINNTGSDIKVGLYDDTQSEACEWNADNGRGYVNSTSNSSLQMPLSSSSAGWYFYDQKIKPFFQIFPQSMWATHNGETVANGGRPLILTYTIYYYKDQSYADTLWQTVKNAFENDFGVEPFLVPCWSWFNADSGMYNVADGECIYGAAGPAGIQTYTVNGYTVSNLGPGRDDSYIGGQTYKARWADGDGNDDEEEDQWLRDNFNEIPGDADLVVLESWNELWEGSALSRCVDYPVKEGGSYLSSTYYMDKLFDLIDDYEGTTPDYDASYVSDDFPSQVTAGQTYTLSVTYTNTGANSWDTTNTRLGTSDSRDRSSDFYYSSDWINDHRPTAVDSATSPDSNGTFTFVVQAPTQTGHYDEDFELVQEGTTWFTGSGDDITWSVDVVSGSQPEEKMEHGDMEGGFWDTGWGGGSAIPNGWDGWYQPGTDFNCYDETSIKHGGSHSAKTTISSGGDAGNGGYKRGIFQNVDVGANEDFTLTVWARHTNGNCPSIMCWNPGYNNSPEDAADNGRYQWVTTDNWGQLNTWVSRDMEGTAPSSGIITVIVGGAHHGGGGSATVYVDDCSVMAAP